MKAIGFALYFALCAFSAPSPRAADSLDFTGTINEFKLLPQMLPAYLSAKADSDLSHRPALTTLADVQKRREYIRRIMIDRIGGFPERTPLNARMVASITKPGYRIEKLIFESQPHFYVTANLYVPTTGHGPYPAILCPTGHEVGAKADQAYQKLLGSFATKGFVGLTWDPLGQGERSQFFDPDLEASKLRDSTVEHSMLGLQALLVGDDLARYEIWDGIRALDYLVSREEVDPKRIGVTGHSGGGTLTAYLAALDDRIQVAAPNCYITSWKRLLAAIGPQDAEQVMPPWLNAGLDFPDFIYAFAPKPYLILSAIQDFFPISGARETYAQAKGVYASLGAADRISMVEGDDGHGYSPLRRPAAYRWFSRFLKDSEDDGAEPAIEVLPYEQLQCTATGQIATSLGGETVYTLNRKRAETLAAKSPDSAAVLDACRRLSGYQKPTDSSAARTFGAIPNPQARIEKLVYQTEPGILVPAILIVPQNGPARKPAVIYVDGRGKNQIGDRLSAFSRQGTVVLAIDARGFGETKTPGTHGAEYQRFFGDYASSVTALLLGKTMAGMRAADISRGVDILSARPEVDPSKIYVTGAGAGAVPALYAAALDPRIRGAAIEQGLLSYRSIVDSRISYDAYQQVVPGVLRHFDLPDLAAAIAPRPVWIWQPVDALGMPVSGAAMRQAYGESKNVKTGVQGPLTY
ncbi:MAG: acetylxylan esterase [Acidobacteriota bacterium]|nr:acetylxylan esterase [Acidobacteriota bacterium]